MRKLFVIMPFGSRMGVEHHDQQPINFDDIYERVIKPAGFTADLVVQRIDEVAAPGRITYIRFQSR